MSRGHRPNLEVSGPTTSLAMSCQSPHEGASYAHHISCFGPHSRPGARTAHATPVDSEAFLAILKPSHRPLGVAYFYLARHLI